jgi:hypothetical protein
MTTRTRRNSYPIDDSAESRVTPAHTDAAHTLTSRADSSGRSS